MSAIVGNDAFVYKAQRDRYIMIFKTTYMIAQQRPFCRRHR